MATFFNFVKKYRFNSVFILSFFKVLGISFVIFTVLLFIAYKYISLRIDMDMSAENKSFTVRIGDMTDDKFRELELAAANIAVDQSIRMYMTASSENRERNGGDIRVNNMVAAYKNLFKTIHSVYIYSEINNFVWSFDGEVLKENFTDKGWFAAYDQTPKNGFTSFARKINGSYPKVITYIKKMDHFGAVILNVDIEAVGASIEGFFDVKNEFFIISNDDTVLYSKNPGLFMSGLTDERVKQAIEKQGIFNTGEGFCAGHFIDSPFYGWKYVGLTSLSGYNAQMDYTNRVFILTLFALVVILLIISYFFAMSAYKPISGLINILEHTDSLNTVNLKDNEIKYLATNFLRVIEDNKQLKDEMRRRLTDYSRYQAMALQSQINPHFLNNTLNSINCGIIEKLGAQDVSSKMLVSLTRIIRYCYVVDKMFVSLKEELDFVKLYVGILKLRYGDFQFTVDVPKSLYGQRFLRLCLQPLVENAVMYGINGKTGGCVLISAKSEDGILSVEVYDNGKGISPEKLNEITGALPSTVFESTHIGLKNVYHRLKVVFGDDADLRVESKRGEFTRAIIAIGNGDQISPEV